MVCSELSRSARPSTKTISGAAPARAERSSASETCTAVVRSRVPISVRNVSSEVWREPVSRAMSLHQSNRLWKYACGRRARVLINHPYQGYDAANNVVTLPFLQEEADPVHHHERRRPPLGLGRLILVGVVHRDRKYPRARVLSADHLLVRGVPVRVGILVVQNVNALVGRTRHRARFLNHLEWNRNRGGVAADD